MTIKKDNISKIREALLADEEKKNNPQNRSFGDNARYPFWDIPMGKSCTVRFLPDEDPDNLYFWRERFDINLPFEGIKGTTTDRVTVQVPCMKTWQKACPIVSETRKWWDSEDTKELARLYYPKRSYLYQGFVVRSDLVEEETPENPIRRFTLGAQIHKIIDAYVKEPDLQYSPTDFENGVDFKINKKQNGQWADYSTSSFSVAGPRALNDSEIAAIDEYGLFCLKDFLPKEPDAEHLAAIQDMFEASVNGEAYDPDRFAEFYRPRGLKYEPKTNSGNSSNEEESEEKDETPASSSGGSASDIIAALKKKRGIA